MFREAAFKTALTISLSLHMLVLSPWNALRPSGIEDKENQIEVTYIVREFVREKIEREIENLPQKYGLEKKPPEERSRETLLTGEEAEKLEGYISYYELVREKIKKRVTRYYIKPGEKGRVEVIFKLARNGSMKELSIAAGSPQSPGLNKIALKAVKSASPFPPFPEALGKDELTFTVAIIFKREAK